MTELNKYNCAVLVLSCDRYKDAWVPFFTLFRKYWSNCPYPIYLGTNEADLSFPNVKVIQSGKARDWSYDTKEILKKIPEKYLIVLLEDYFITGNVDSSLLEKSIAVTQSENAVFTRLASFRADHFPMYAYDVMCEASFMGVTRKDAPFRINLQAGIWNRESFIDLILEGESPWEFEVKGSERSQKMDRRFLGIADNPAEKYVHGPIPYLCTAITKGVWMREAIALCKKENVEIDTSIRPIESWYEYTKRRLYHGFSFGTRKYLDFIALKLRGKKN